MKKYPIIFISIILVFLLTACPELFNKPPTKPVLIKPDDGSYNQPAENLLLQWDCSDPDEDPVSYDIYFGVETLNLIDANHNQKSYTLTDLKGNTPYQWKIVAKDNKGYSTESDVWTFTTKNRNPLQPANPFPSNNATNVSVNTKFNWDCTDLDGDLLTFDFYFGNEIPPALVATEITVNEYNHGKLKYETSYHWRISAKDNMGGETEGETWTFTTRPATRFDLTVTSSPVTDLNIVIDENEYKTPKTLPVKINTPVEIEIEKIQEFDKETIVDGNDTRYLFNKWNDLNTKENRTVNITSDVTFTAIMNKEYKVETDTNPYGLTEIENSEWYVSNTVHAFTAPEVTGYTFDYWKINGVNEGSTNPIQISINSPKKVVAVYKVNEYTLTVNAENGTVNKSPDKNIYTHGTTVELEAIPDEGFIFDHWEGDLTGTNNPQNVLMNSNKTVTAVFEVYTNEPPTISKESGSSGTINQNSSTFSWNGNDPDGEIIEYQHRKDSGSWYSNGLNTSYTWSGYSEGSHTFEVRAKDDNSAYSNIISWSFNYQPETTTGKFKVANSWGIGDWENIADGFLYITYDAMIENNVRCYIISPNYGYEPNCIAVFKIDHDIRNDCTIKIGVGDPDNPTKEKSFVNTFYDGGKHPFPDNKIVLDITEFLPIDDNVYLKVYDGQDSNTGTIEYFAIEYYSNYTLSNPDQIYTATGLPINTTNNNSTIIKINNVNFSDVYQLSSKELDKYITRILTEEDFDVEESNNLNEIYDGHGTGLLPLTEEEIEWLKENALTITDVTALETLPSNVDNSTTIYFPPIGDQDGVGSCVAFSIGYYTNTYYQAINNGWDLSGAQWEGGYYGEPTSSYQDKIMSPNFIYNQINNGQDKGSSYTDAIKVVSIIGECSWEKFPYKTSNETNYCTEWPYETAWREAPKYRSSKKILYYLPVNDSSDIQTIKSLLNDGYLVSIAVDASKYENLTNEDVWNTSNYNNVSTNHANTIVGYME